MPEPTPDDRAAAAAWRRERDGVPPVYVAVVEDAYLAGLLAERRRAGPTGWRDIATAPKDGREVLLLVEQRAGIPGKMLVGHYQPGGHCIEDHPAIDDGWYFWNGTMFDKASKPIRWQPLPEPPPAGDADAR